MSSRYIVYYKSPIGILEIISSDKDLISVSFVKRKGREKVHPFLLKCLSQLDEYFKGQRRSFSLPLKIQGTTFQELVWQKLLGVSFGKTLSYQDIVGVIGNKSAARAVGNALNKNRIAIIIPCHRIIGRRQDLVGYAGGLWRKEWLLEHEKFLG